MTDLPLIADSLDAVPEDVRKFYTAGEEGKFNLNATELFSAMQAKEKALANERKISSDFEKKYKTTAKEFEGVDKNELKKLQEEQKKWTEEKEQKEREALEASGKYQEALEKTKTSHDKQINDLKTQFDGKITELTNLVETTEGDKRNYILNDKIRRAINKAGVISEDNDDVFQLTKGNFGLDENLNAVVKDSSGNTISGQTLESYFEDFKKQKPKFFQGTNSSGSGSPGGGSKGNVHLDAKDMTSVDKISAGLQKKNA